MGILIGRLSPLKKIGSRRIYSLERYPPRSSTAPLQDSHASIGYDIIRNSKVDLVTNKLDGDPIDMYVTGIRGTCDWDQAGTILGHEDCDPSGKWVYNRVVWEIRYDNNVNPSKPFGFHVNTRKAEKSMFGEHGQLMNYQEVAFYQPGLAVGTPESHSFYISARGDLTRYTGWDLKWASATAEVRESCANMVRYLWTHLH
ncbi:hypothetical protein P170DRAFT_474872 [Aspergillus steynii IBT 23096]|uniref:Uncharacterized protein n=1 Tax=Aspergillus steynii IBT 23096 TaxID=1392250 RepID=A0A2I2GEN8_9EURO|nr:uncharacterized protein P170DRAFT_474872 [Aspergillus steynii IBT 23096]PLB51330.1 hypothetical protein P170DRAFT_474872 [Aspergillus steynii IBT 23096]